MEYPRTATNAVLAKIVEAGFSPYYDIVWSFDYYVQSLSADSQLGFCIFLQDVTSGVVYDKEGNGGIDLGYSGLLSAVSYSPTLTISSGIENAIIGIGFDSTGCFATSASVSGSVIRDGVNDNNRITNSLSIRGSYPDYNWSDYSVNIALSDFNFNILDTNKKTIRARLGNVGQTIYIDYRHTPLEDFRNILTQNVSLSFNSTTRFRPGVTFVKPVSGTASQPVVRISNITAEGLDQTPVLATKPVLTVSRLPTVVPLTGCLITNCQVPLSSSISPPPPPLSIYSVKYSICNITSHTSVINNSLVEAYNAGYESGVKTYDFYNYGYTLLLSSYNTTVKLYRTDYYEYKSLDNSIVLSLSNQLDVWRLNTGVYNYTNNTNSRPVGTYQLYTITYVDE